jgi:protoheme IX farnesyltransferase
VILYHGTDVLTTVLGVGNIALYAGVYTHMKPRSEWNTWVGAVVGAVPPVMGYTAAVSAGTSSIATCSSLMELAEPAFLGTTLFLWQFPHFFALNWMYREDYKRGGFAMVSSNDPDGSRTASLITRYTFYLSSLPVLSSVMEVTSPMFAVEGVVLNAYALHVARRFDKERSNANARKVFLTSLWYLPCLLTLFLFHSRKWHEQENDDTIKGKDEGGAFLLDWMSKIQEMGREACLHELLVQKNVWVGLLFPSSSSEKKDQTGVVLDEKKCPIAIAKGSAIAAIVDDEKKSEDDDVVVVVDDNKTRENGSV